MNHKQRRRIWTKADLRELRTMAKKGAGARRIARHFKRTQAAVRTKACTLGISLAM